MEYSFGKKLRDLRASRGLTQDGLADALNEKFNTLYNKGMISKWENDREEPRMDAVRNLTRFFGITLDEILGLDGEIDVYEDIYTESTNVPIIKAIIEGDIFVPGNIQGYIPVLSQFLGSGNYFFFEIENDSMDMEFPAGSFVLVEKTHEIKGGQIAIVKIDAQETTIRKVIFGKNSLSLVPMSSNREYQPEIYNLEDNIEVIGRVIQAIKFY
ncbi:XRE family transcriptional regulator [Paenibacillus campi]|uniref:XRE family transcriptional regulator n=1 Tax=Paenibacillus campi TaxID=3106031 RepID=UPI002AFE5483|nr:XRE family transcriptional regulator [Paenibacillus sp. SGZ-1014]